APGQSRAPHGAPVGTHATLCGFFRMGAAPARSGSRARNVVQHARDARPALSQGHFGHVAGARGKSARLAARRHSTRTIRYTRSMLRLLRIGLALGALALAAPVFAQDEAMILIAHPAFRDLEYRQTVLIASPAPNGGH